VASPAFAGIIFSDNFDTEHGGVGILNYNAFANWTVGSGTVDLIGNGFFDFLPGNGLYIDMDGSTGDAGMMTSKFVLAAGQYTLQFDLAGNHRNTASESVTVQVALGTVFSKTYSLTQNDPFITFTETITVPVNTIATLSFTGLGGDNIGMLLDDVKIATVSEPGSLFLLGLGFAGLGAMTWRRRQS
jgi:hypothetical protein